MTYQDGGPGGAPGAELRPGGGFYRPPPNPTKMRDSRSPGYVASYGMESWELDALEPQVLDGLISDAIEYYLDLDLDLDLYEEMLALEEEGKAAIRGGRPDVAGRWSPGE